MISKEALFYKKEGGDGQIRCYLCAHRCLIPIGAVGKCGARHNDNSVLRTLNYGYPVSIDIDPIEKKPLYHFLPGSMVYSLGTLGCNFICGNCHNWRQSQVKDLRAVEPDSPFTSPDKIVEDAIGNGCPSIAYTYNEPTIFTEYALEIMKLATANDVKNIWVSNGYMSSECLDAVLPFLDAANIDLKSMSEKFYLNNCGGKLSTVLQNLTRLKMEQIHLEISTLIIPGFSDDVDELSNMAEFIVDELGSDTPWHLTKFISDISYKMQNVTETGDDIIYEAFQIAKDAGMKYVYVGNIPGDQRENTYCPKCNELAVRRFGYHVERLDSGGRCAYCDRSLDIIE